MIIEPWWFNCWRKFLSYLGLFAFCTHKFWYAWLTSFNKYKYAWNKYVPKTSMAATSESSLFPQFFSPIISRWGRKKPWVGVGDWKTNGARIFGSQEGLDIGKKHMVQTPKHFNTNRGMNTYPVCSTNRSSPRKYVFVSWKHAYSGKERPGLLLYAQICTQSLCAFVVLLALWCS